MSESPSVLVEGAPPRSAAAPPEVRRLELMSAFLAGGLCLMLTYVVPALSPYQPWREGEPLPVIGALMPQSAPRVVEDERGELVEAPPPEVVEPPPPPVVLAGVGTLPSRPPGVPTALEDADYRGMDRYYRALANAAAGSGIARAIHYGDSTIAADGITSTVRSRMQARFGNGGPGFLPAGMDPRWNMRSDVTISRQGSWTTHSLLNGGNSGRFGLGGIASTASSGSYLVIRGPKDAAGAEIPLFHSELWYRGEGGAKVWASANDQSVGEAVASGAGDTRLVKGVPTGFNKYAFGASGGSVLFYGAVLETKGPGVTWESLGVVGVGSKSFGFYNKKHLSDQTAMRNPDLVVIMLGGNEAGYPVLMTGDGMGYLQYFQGAIRAVRAGAPSSSCLVVSPLDQGTRDVTVVTNEDGTTTETRGPARSKPSMKRLVDVERYAAATEGCAFWDARGAMGGEGAIVKWGAKRPPLAWADLLHLSGAGLDIIGNLLADAIEFGYDGWTAAGGLSRKVPTPPGPPVVAEAPATPATP